MIVYKCKYFDVDYDTESGIYFSNRFKIKNDKQYKESINKAAEALQTLKPEFLIISNKEVKYPVSPDLQEWAIKIIVPIVLKYGLKKVVYIAGEDFIENIAFQQIVERAKMIGINIDFANTEKEAYIKIKQTFK